MRAQPMPNFAEAQKAYEEMIARVANKRADAEE